MATIDPRMLEKGGGASDQFRDETEDGREASEDASEEEYEGETYTVEKIVDYACFDKFPDLPKGSPMSEDRYEVKYFTKWLGYDNFNDNTWEPKENWSVESVWAEFVRDCERTKPADQSHEAVLREVERKNRREKERRKKQEEEAKKSVVMTAIGKRKRDSRTDSVSSTSTSSSAKPRKAQAAYPPSSSSSTARGESSKVHLSSVELRRLRGDYIDQGALNDMIEASGSKALRELRMTPPPQPKPKRSRREDSTEARQDRSNGDEEDGKGKGKAKEVHQERRPRIVAPPDSATQTGSSSTRQEAKGFAMESDEEEVAEEQAKEVHQERKPEIPAPPDQVTQNGSTSRRKEEKGFAVESDDDEEEEVPLAQLRNVAPATQASHPVRATGFASENDDDDYDENGPQNASQLVRPRQPDPAPRAQAQDMPITSTSSKPSTIVATIAKGFADSSDEEEDEAGGENAPTPAAANDSGFRPSTPTGFASESGSDGGMEVETAPTTRQLSKARGFAESDDEDEDDQETMQVEEEETGQKEDSLPVVQGKETDKVEGKVRTTQAGKDETGANARRLEARMANDQDQETVTREDEVVERSVGNDEGQEKRKSTKKGKEKEKGKEKKSKSRAAEPVDKVKGGSTSKPIKKTPSAPTNSKGSTVNGGRQSPPPATKTKRKRVVEPEEEDEPVPKAKAPSKPISREDALKKLKIGRVSREEVSAGHQRSPSVNTTSATDQHSNSHGSGNNRRQEEDPFNFGKQRPTSKNGYIVLNASVLQFKKLPEAIAGNGSSILPVGAPDHERIRSLWKIGQNPLVNFQDFDQVLSHREVYVTPPPTQGEIGTNKRAAAHEKDYQALQLVLAHVEGVKQADSLRPAVSAVFVHASLANELGRFPGKLSELDHLRERDDVVCLFYGTGADKQRALRQFWKPLTAITFTPAALVENPQRLGQLLKTASSSHNDFDGTRDQFPFMLPQYLLPGGAFGAAVDQNEVAIPRSAEERAKSRTALETIFSLIRDNSLSLTNVAPLLDESRLDQTRFPAFDDRTPADPVIWMKLSQCYKPRFCRVSLERLQKLVCTWRSQYATIRRWIIVATRDEISSLGSAPGVILATLDEAEALVDAPLTSILG
ncbi:chromo domain-containing protein [Sporobolomyces salmoneus]|uniref:chromo domain-containing protein n=1 Tax=Sporobolomyces salmoneus TaxID=183962 RepID=UPI003172AD98